MRTWRAWPLLAILVGLLQGAGVAAQPTPQAPTFRTAATLVPLDVRVIDRKTGRPVEDLTREDFQVLENGVTQRVLHFERQRLAVDTVAPRADSVSARATTEAPPRAGTHPAIRTSALTLSTQSTRLFLLVLGRGRLQHPSGGLDAALRFVRDSLLPHDLVAVYAYGRATEFTTDHARVARIIERFKAENDGIDAEMNNEMAGLAGVYGSRSLPKALRARIERLFQDDDVLASRDLGFGEPAAVRAAIDKNWLVPSDPPRQGDLGPGAARTGPAGEWGRIRPDAVGFDAFVAANVQTLQDLGSIHAAIAYLRELDGEKHLVLLTEYGFLLPRVEDDRDLIEAASDARVVIDVIQTGGVIPVNAALAARSLRTIAQSTGGLASISAYSQPALERLDGYTRTGYLLGYYPSNTRWDGRFRTIEVKVRRPGVMVLVRRGYYARSEIPLFSRRGFIVHNRLLAAAVSPAPIHDIALKLETSVVRSKAGRDLIADLRIDPAALSFVVRDGVRTGRIDIGQFGTGETGKILCEGWQTAELAFSDETFRAVSASGIAYRVRMPLKPGVRTVTVVVYDYEADRVGVVRQPLRPVR